MKFIDPGFEELKYDNPLLLGERCTRVCYKSEDKIAEGSAKKLLNGVIKSGHSAMIEHISVYMKMSEKQFNEIVDPENPVIKIVFSPYTKYVICEGELYISTNLRVLYDADRSMVDEYMENEGNRFMFTCGLSNYKFEDYADYFYRRVTILFTMDRIGSQSFCRHRTLSFAQESTRWCNYVRAKFGSEISIITPCWLKDGDLAEYEEDMKVVEKLYFKWLDKGYKAEEARAFLPFGLKTEIVMTGFVDAWEHFFELRVDHHAHSQARELAGPLEEYFKENKYL
jgi:thymidylate synthase (FAD)